MPQSIARTYTPLEETARALDKLVREAAKCVGIQGKHNYPRFVAAQMYYSLIGRDIEYEVAPFCVDAGIGIVVWSPLAGGLLTGRYTRQDPGGGKGSACIRRFPPSRSRARMGR